MLVAKVNLCSFQQLKHKLASCTHSECVLQLLLTFFKHCFMMCNPVYDVRIHFLYRLNSACVTVIKQRFSTRAGEGINSRLRTVSFSVSNMNQGIHNIPPVRPEHINFAFRSTLLSVTGAFQPQLQLLVISLLAPTGM